MNALSALLASGGPLTLPPEQRATALWLLDFMPRRLRSDPNVRKPQGRALLESIRVLTAVVTARDTLSPGERGLLSALVTRVWLSMRLVQTEGDGDEVRARLTANAPALHELPLDRHRAFMALLALVGEDAASLAAFDPALYTPLPEGFTEVKDGEHEA